MNIFDCFFSLGAYIIRRKEVPNLIRPRTLSEKILIKKLFPSNDERNLRCLISDRLKVRNFVKENSPDCNLINILWEGKGAEFSNDIWNKLPNKFVLKANHGSKMVTIIDKTIDTYEDIYKKAQKWLQTDYYKRGREWVYKELERLLIVEEFIQFNHDVPPDYKFFCLNGIVQFVQVDSDRYTSHTRNLYSKEFNLLDVKYEFDNGPLVDKPILFKKAVEIAEELSSNFDFIRVDLYILEDRIYFGELTNFPGNCLERFYPKSFDLEIGKLLKVNK